MSAVMQQAIQAGVDIINDVNAFVDDPQKLTLLAKSKVGLLTMHSNRDVEYTDLSTEMLAFFTKNLQALEDAGIARELRVVGRMVVHAADTARRPQRMAGMDLKRLTGTHALGGICQLVGGAS